MFTLARMRPPLKSLTSLLLLPSLAPAQPHLPVRSAMQVPALFTCPASDIGIPAPFPA